MMLDALPYIDPVNEDYEQYALALIEAEMKQTRTAPQHPLLADKPLNLRTQIMKDSMERQQQDRGKLETTTFPDRVVVPPPDDDNNSVQAWTHAAQQARIAYESERLRAVQLEVDKEESSSQWQRHLRTVVQPQHEAVQQQLRAQRQIVEEINHARQTEQQEVYGRQLQVLTAQYEELVQRQMQLKLAVARLEEEVGQEPQPPQHS